MATLTWGGWRLGYVNAEATVGWAPTGSASLDMDALEDVIDRKRLTADVTGSESFPLWWLLSRRGWDIAFGTRACNE